MAYVAIQGGEEAIRQADRLREFLRTRQGEKSRPVELGDIACQLEALHSRILSEGGLYHEELASLALKQSMGDPLEAAFALRAYRSTRPRNVQTSAHSTETMRLIRRISAAFKDIPGGQILGPTPDFSLRLMRFELMQEPPREFARWAGEWLSGLPEDNVSLTMPKVVDILRQRGLLAEVDPAPEAAFDVTREPLVFPIPRSAALQTMARGETGGMLALAYSNMRGYGDLHPTVGELRVGYLPVHLPHPVSGQDIEIGEVLMTECEMITKYESKADGPPQFTLGYGACFGHNETKAIAMAVLDRCLQKGQRDGAEHPAEDQEYVLLHIDGIDSMGFCNHFKMPHYVTFQAEIDALGQTRARGGL
ncbi:MAG: carbon-phosphorus lyase complex subunit PhnI [Desulfovermiculus sp.]